MTDLIRQLGGPTAIARKLNIKPPSVISWKGRPPADRCPDLERAYEGQFTCEQMRPDVRWHRVPDPGWPHPGGRPLIDVAAQDAGAEPAAVGGAEGEAAHAA